ncbi:MAG: hypothetical protein AAF696_12105 [Bacteroidota bacterium]
MQEILRPLFELSWQKWMVYILFYGIWGIAMNQVGMSAKIARFKYKAQIISCYLLYMVPISILLNPLPWYEQYFYGLFFMGILELGGYSIKSSIAYENNILDKIFSPRNFTLAMTLFFASYFPLGNWIVENIHSAIFS